MAKRDDEKYCIRCGVAIARIAQVCPACGTRQPPPPPPLPKGGNKLLKGCMMAVVAFFAGTFAIGIIAAIVIPKFAVTKEKAYVAEMRTDLRNLVSAEVAYRDEHESYQANLDSLPGFTLSSGVKLVQPIQVGKNGWSATVKRDGSTVQCTVAVGDRVAFGAQAAEPTCTR